MKYLIAGLGNIGLEYSNTRHNIGFKTLEVFANASNVCFETDRYASRCNIKFKGKTLILIKPSTYMNLSGKAVNYWLQKENIPLQNLLVITDDLALPLGTLRLKPKGGSGGHNGLTNIEEILNTQNYSRLRFGIGNDFGYGYQSNYVLGNWNDDEIKAVNEKIPTVIDIVKSFVSIGVERTMNMYNKK